MIQILVLYYHQIVKVIKSDSQGYGHSGRNNWQRGCIADHWWPFFVIAIHHVINTINIIAQLTKRMHCWPLLMSDLLLKSSCASLSIRSPTSSSSSNIINNELYFFKSPLSVSWICPKLQNCALGKNVLTSESEIEPWVGWGNCLDNWTHSAAFSENCKLDQTPVEEYQLGGARQKWNSETLLLQHRLLLSWGEGLMGESAEIFVQRDSNRGFFAPGNPVEIIWNLHRPCVKCNPGWGRWRSGGRETEPGIRLRTNKQMFSRVKRNLFSWPVTMVSHLYLIRWTWSAAQRW